MIAVPRREVSIVKHVMMITWLILSFHFLQICSAPSDKCQLWMRRPLEGLGTQEFFLAYISSLKRELIRCSPRGQ